MGIFMQIMYGTPAEHGACWHPSRTWSRISNNDHSQSADSSNQYDQSLYNSTIREIFGQCYLLKESFIKRCTTSSMIISSIIIMDNAFNNGIRDFCFILMLNVGEIEDIIGQNNIHSSCRCQIRKGVLERVSSCILW